jgi:predicted lipid carrier protein YhbT
MTQLTRDRIVLGAARALARLPSRPGSALLAAGLNLALAGEELRELAPLIGKTIRIRTTDAELRFDFVLARDGFAVASGSSTPEVTISASAPDLLRLALHEADPDTLFFSRRLTMEGDTELGLMLRNRLDAIDLHALFARPPSIRALAAALRTGVFG